MIDSIDERPSPKNRALIRDILMQEWDPIRVRNFPGAPKDEYDWYIDDVYSLITDKHTSQEKIAAYLLAVQNERMRLRVTDAARERCHRAARSLIALQTQLGVR
jgi:hypothetical protein